MNKKVIVVLGLLFLLLLAGGLAYSMINKKPTSTKDSKTPQISSTSTSQSSAPKSLKDLLTSGVSQKCTFKDKMKTVDINGVTYVSGGKMRGDFTSLVEGKQIATHMVVDGKTNYVWVDGQENGFKMSVDQSEENSNPNIKTTQAQQIDVNKTMDISCSPWITNGTLFIPPSNIKFTDYSNLTVPTTGASSSGGATMPEIDCSVCDNLSGEAKTQCLTALKCS